jgi:hypothetical protein
MRGFNYVLCGLFFLLSPLFLDVPYYYYQQFIVKPDVGLNTYRYLLIRV